MRKSIFDKPKWYGFVISAVVFGGLMWFGWMALMTAEAARDPAAALRILQVMGGGMFVLLGAGAGMITYLADHRAHQLWIAQHALEQMADKLDEAKRSPFDHLPKAGEDI